MGKFADFMMAAGVIPPRFPEIPISTVGPVAVPDPPNTTPTSFITKPISVVTAVDMLSVGSISKRQLMSIPAARQAITLLCGLGGSFPYHSFNAKGESTTSDWSWLIKPERMYVRSVTMTRTMVDMLLYGEALWVVDERGADGWATSYERVDKERWQRLEGKIRVSDEYGKTRDVGPEDVRLFTAPFDGLLKDAGPTVKLYYDLHRLGRMYANNPAPREHFTVTDGSDYSKEQIDEFLSDWLQRRREGLTAFIPDGLHLDLVEQMSPEDMLLVAAQEAVIAEIARLFNVAPTWLGLQVTTRQYSNLVDDKRALVELAVAPTLLKPFEERLSGDDFIARGQTVKANMDAWLRPNTLDRMNAYAVGKPIGAYTTDEIRNLENKPPLTAAEKRELNNTPTGGPNDGA